MTVRDLEFINGRYSWKGRHVDLSRKAIRLVGVLTARPDQIASYIEIVNAVWEPGHRLGSGFGAVRAAIRSLADRTRKYFEDVDPTFDRIVAEPGAGLRWITTENVASRLAKRAQNERRASRESRA